MPATSPKNPEFTSLLYDDRPRREFPNERMYGHPLRVSDAHPLVLRDTLFVNRDSLDARLMRWNIAYVNEPRRFFPSPNSIDNRFESDLRKRAAYALEHLHLFNEGKLAAGMAILTEHRVYLGAPIQFARPPVFSSTFVKYGANRSVFLSKYGITRSGIRGAHLVRTAQDRAHGTWSVQFWTETSDTPLAAPETVHLIYGLSRDDAEVWCELLTPQETAQRQMLPEWAATRASLEYAGLSLWWRALSPLVCLSFVAPVVLVMRMGWDNSEIVFWLAMLAPVWLYWPWRWLWRMRLAQAAGPFARHLGIEQHESASP